MAINQEKINDMVNAFDNRFVQQEQGKGLSTNDFSNAYRNKIDGLARVASTGSYNDLINLPTVESLGAQVTVTKQTTADSGYSATYVVKQNNQQVGSKINIPKDFLVKSGEVKVATSGDLSTLGDGYSVGDKYIDFVINSKTDDAINTHMYVNVKDLVEDTTYTADESSLTLSNENVLSIKDNGIATVHIQDNAITTAKILDTNVTTGKIKNKAVTAAKIADHTITATQIATSLSDTWLTDIDVENTIEDYIVAITTALNQ